MVHGGLAEQVAGRERRQGRGQDYRCRNHRPPATPTALARAGWCRAASRNVRVAARQGGVLAATLARPAYGPGVD